jgi:1,4-dihydroxy-2-naphthoate octaprenyltransferase
MVKRITNKDIMDKLEEMDKKNTLTSLILFLYALAIALLIGYFSTFNIWLSVTGIFCYLLGIALSLRNKFKLP